MSDKERQPGEPAAARPLAGRTVLGIFAHPDDESLACGGTLARLADAGARVVVMCASRGEAGSVSDPSIVAAGENLGIVRVRELNDAAGVLGVAEVIVLDYADSTLRWARVAELHSEIVSTLERYRPDAVITFAEDGLYWHLDHIGIHERTYTAVLSLGAGAPPLYYVTMPEGIMLRLVEAARAKGAPSNPSLWGIAAHSFGHCAKPPTFVIDVRQWVPRKLAALRCHRTQIDPANPIAWIDDEEARQWLGIEQFRRSPLDTTAEPILEHLGTAQHAR